MSAEDPLTLFFTYTKGYKIRWYLISKIATKIILIIQVDKPSSCNDFVAT